MPRGIVATPLSSGVLGGWGGVNDTSGVDRSKATKTWDPNEWTNPYGAKMPYHPAGCQCPTCRLTGSKGGVAPGLPYFPELRVVDYGSVTVADKEEAAEYIKKLMYEAAKRNQMTGDYHSQSITITCDGQKSRYLVLERGGIDNAEVPIVELTGAVFSEGIEVIEKLVTFEESGARMRLSVQRWKA